MSGANEHNTNDSPETDERFPSGEWKGFWLQRSVYAGQRGWMQLLLKFSNGVVHGEGRDRNGDFTIRGDYNVKSGEVAYTKAYAYYDVFYKGWAEIDKGIWGVWELPDDRDGLHIWPRGMADPTKSALEAEADQPVEEEKVVLVGGVG